MSISTANKDKHEKKLIYQSRMRVPEYFWYDPFNTEDWAGFRLRGGTYQSIPLNPQGVLDSELLGLTLVRWQGTFKTVEATWLRWTYPNGTLLLTAEEQERQRAEQAENQVQQIARNLLQTGFPIEQIAQITGLAIAQIDLLNE